MYASVEVIINDNGPPSVIACSWDNVEQAVASASVKYCQYIKDSSPTTMYKVMEFVRNARKIGYGNVSFHVVKV